MAASSPTKTRKQIADEYGVSPRTMRRWFKKHDIPNPQRLICPREQGFIYRVFGKPQADNPSEKQRDGP